MLNKNVFEANWKEIRGRSQEWWSLINDVDLKRLDKSPSKLDKYVVLLQVKYGYTKEHARAEIDRRVEAQEAEENQVLAMKPNETAVAAPRKMPGKS